MNMNLKRGVALTLAALGIAAVGAVSAQVMQDLQLPEQQPEQWSAADMEGAPADLSAVTPTETVAAAPEPVAQPEPIVVAQAAPVTQPAPVVQRNAIPTERVMVQLPRSVSSRSGEGSLEEIAVRTAPIDERAGLSPLYIVDHSPGL